MPPTNVRRSSKPKPKPAQPSFVTAHPTLAFALLAGLVVLLLYGKALSNPFVYDDLDQVVHNPNLATLPTFTHRFLLAPVMFSNEFRDAAAATGSTWRPVFWISLALDRRLHGPSAAAGFHATNLLLHWLNGLLLFTLLRRVRLRLLPAGVATLLWLTLPINSEAVAWVSGRAYLLAVFFLLLALLAACSFLRRRRPLTLLAAAATSLLALLSNELGLLLVPFTLLLVVALRHAAEIAEAGAQRGDRARKEASAAAAHAPLARLATPFLLSALLATDALYLTVRHRIGVSAGPGAPALWAIAPTFWKYLGWILLPLHMSVERSTSTPANIPSPTGFVAAVALLALLAAAVFFRRRLPTFAAGLALTALALLPFCGVVPLYQGMAERFPYVASFGVALTLTALAFRFARASRQLSLAALALFGLGSVLRLHARVADWADPATLYQSSLVATPRSAGLYFNLAFTARERGDLQTAAQEYRRATELRPTYERAWASLGDVDARLGHPADAVQAFGHALALNPGDAPTTTSLAVSLADLGQRQAAERTFHRALALAPGDSTPYTDLAVLLAGEGRIDEAIQAWQTATTVNPTDATAYFDLGVLFQGRGQDDLALPFYRKVLTLKPDDPDTLINISHLHTHG